MKFTNNYELPIVFENILNQELNAPSYDRVSVTDLIKPIWLYYLKVKHWDELEDDISNRLWALLGTSVHYILQKGKPENSMSECKLEVDVDGVTLVGVADLYNDGVVEDYKITSVWSFMFGEKEEWTKQLNCYAWMFQKLGYPVKELKIHAILRDWTKSRVKDDYPEIPFKTVKVELWDFNKQNDYIKSRLALIKGLQNKSISEIQVCSEQERWTRYDKKENKYIDIRCKDYCTVRKVCERYIQK